MGRGRTGEREIQPLGMEITVRAPPWRRVVYGGLRRGIAVARPITGKRGLMSFLQNSLRVAFVMTGSLLACLAALAKPLPPNEGKIEYNAGKREYLLARRYIRTGPFWRRHYWHCPV